MKKYSTSIYKYDEIRNKRRNDILITILYVFE